MTPEPTCPHCGAELEPDLPIKVFQCGSTSVFVGEGVVRSSDCYLKEILKLRMENRRLREDLKAWVSD